MLLKSHTSSAVLKRAKKSKKQSKAIKHKKKAAIKDCVRKIVPNNVSYSGIRLVNSTNKQIISEKVVFAKTMLQKLRGLMFRRRKDVNYAMIFDFGRASKKSAAIHMFFVFFPIDIVYLRDGRVVDMHKAVPPFTSYLAPKERADTLIELPQGAIWQSGINIGDAINIIQ